MSLVTRLKKPGSLTSPDCYHPAYTVVYIGPGIEEVGWVRAAVFFAPSSLRNEIKQQQKNSEQESVLA
jgi:hypothetical protein